MTQASTTGPVAGESNPSLERFTIHWTAGSPTQTFDHYHYCVQGDGKVVNTLPVAAKGSHCWMRNTGNVGIAACGSSINAVQMEHIAKLVAELAVRHAIDLNVSVILPRLAYDRVHEALVPAGGTIQAPALADHEWYAREDGYYPERVDIGEANMATLRKKAAWYRVKLEAGALPFEYVR
jgi:hypothetical protein